MNTKNKRIDLTQLEWMISDYRKKAEEKTGRTLLDLDAIAMVPELIADLKRCYEEIDDLKRQYQSCNEALIETTNWNVRMVEAIDSGKMSAIKRVRNS